MSVKYNMPLCWELFSSGLKCLCWNCFALINVLLLLVQVLVAEVLKALVPVKEMLEVPVLVLFSYV